MKYKLPVWTFCVQNLCPKTIRFAASRTATGFLSHLHIAWASIEARTKLMNIIAGQIKEFFRAVTPDNISCNAFYLYDNTLQLFSFQLTLSLLFSGVIFLKNAHYIKSFVSA